MDMLEQPQCNLSIKKKSSIKFHTLTLFLEENTDWPIYGLMQEITYLIASRDPVSVQLLSGNPALSGAIWILHPDSF
jgi:hypothetical protein